MKDTKENRQLVIDHFKGSAFTTGGGSDYSTPSQGMPFMLFGLGWGQMFLKCITIHFGSENIKPHIEIEYSPCSTPSSYYYMELTEENIKKLPKTDGEYFEKFHSLLTKKKEVFLNL